MLLTLLVAGIAVLVGCWPVVQSQPPEAISAGLAPTQPSRGAGGAANSLVADAAKPTAKPVAAKPTAAPTLAAAAPKPTAPSSPVANSTARTTASPVAVVATSVAGFVAAGPSPAVSTDARSNAQSDVLGVATSAGAVAAANASDAEAVALCGPGAVLSTRAGQLIGRPATIAIPRVTASYQPNTRGQPTFLNDAPSPNHIFTAVVWAVDRRQFQPAPESWQGKSVCVTGPVELNQQRPQITINSPSQLRAAP